MAGLRILVTGCSGGGKSTLVTALAARGHATVAEPGRRVIAAARDAGGDQMPWDNPLAFAEACLATAQTDWRAAGAGVTLFDRGVVDAALALRRLGAVDRAHAALAGFPYDRVFLAPPWRALFEAAADPDRRHGYDAAVAEYDDITATLPALGPRVERLPQAGVGERVAWVEARLAAG